MSKRTTVRIPDDLADCAEAVARAQGTSVNQLIVSALSREIECVRSDKDFIDQLAQLAERDREILDRLAE